MLKSFRFSSDATGGNGKLDQADIVARLAGFTALLAPLNLTLPDLISQHASLTVGKTTLETEIAKLKGDNTKLVAGATISVDLVTAANDLAAITKERDTLKAEKTTFDVAVAVKVAALGIKDSTKLVETAPASGKKLSLDEEAAAFLKANPTYQASANLVQADAAK